MLGQETVDDVGVLEGGEVDVETDGAGLLLNGGEDVVEVLENRGVDGKQRALEVRGADGGEEEF